MSILNVVLSIALILLVAFNVLFFFGLYGVWVRNRKERKRLAFLAHMELFSLCDWRLIVPEGDHPTEEAEAERFRKWRYN